MSEKFPDIDADRAVRRLFVDNVLLQAITESWRPIGMSEGNLGTDIVFESDRWFEWIDRNSIRTRTKRVRIRIQAELEGETDAAT